MILAVIFPTLAQAEIRSWGTANIVQAPEGFSYTISEVMYTEPRAFSIGTGVTRRLEIVQVVVKGTGFLPKATGPVIWLNGIPTLRTTVAEDGTSVEALFLETLHTIESAAARMDRWELIFQPHEGSRQVYRVSPTGFAADVDRQRRGGHGIRLFARCCARAAGRPTWNREPRTPRGRSDAVGRKPRFEHGVSRRYGERPGR